MELGPENKLGGKTVGFPFALHFPLQTLDSPGAYVQEGDQAVATDNAAGGIVGGRAQWSVPQTLRRAICHLFNVHGALLLYLNFSRASSEKTFLAYSNFKVHRLCSVPALSISYRELRAPLLDGKGHFSSEAETEMRKRS